MNPQLVLLLLTSVGIWSNPTNSTQSLRRLQANGGVLCPTSIGRHSHGYKQIGSSKYFYMTVDADSPKGDTPSFVWFAGGPGVSSVSSVLSLIGPCYLDTDNKTPKLNGFSWTKNARGIFIDAPGTVGFSEGRVPTTMTEYVDVIYNVLVHIAAEKPEFGKNLHLLGISFDSETISLLASRILAEKPANINLKGLLVISGATGSIDKYKGCLTMAKSLVDRNTYRHMQSSLSECEKNIRKCQPRIPGAQPNKDACQEAALSCDFDLVGPVTREGTSIYDVRAKIGKESTYYPIKTGKVEDFFNDRGVQAALDVHKQWTKQSQHVNNALRIFAMVDISYGIQQALDAGLQVLFVGGDRDYITNFCGLYNWMARLTGRYDYGKKVTRSFGKTLKFPQSGNIGKIRKKTFANGARLGLIKVKDASHSVMWNNPAGMQGIVDAYFSGAIYQ